MIQSFNFLSILQRRFYGRAKLEVNNGSCILLTKNWYTSLTEMVHAAYRSGTLRLPKWYTVVTKNWYTVDYRLQQAPVRTDLQIAEGFQGT